MKDWSLIKNFLAVPFGGGTGREVFISKRDYYNYCYRTDYPEQGERHTFAVTIRFPLFTMQHISQNR